MNREEKQNFLNNLRRRYPRRNSSGQTKEYIKVEEVIEFWLGDRGTSIYNNRLDSKEFNIPLEETHDRIRFGHGTPIMMWIPKCSCSDNTMKRR